MLFTMYIKPLSAIIDSHSIIHHSFADDLQLQMSAPPDRISELLHSMQSCISDVMAWATANTLKLNDSKTELMLVTSKRSMHLHNLPTSITIGNAQIPFKQSVKNLGFTLDCHLTMNAHVSNIARTCYSELRRGGGGVDPIPCVSTHRISDPRSGPAQLLPPHVKQRSHPHGVRPQLFLNCVVWHLFVDS